ncbi:MAG TPA: hypothetical protein VK116_04745 [Planctomycetota bacterium]|nr:hypothetical protein [Planctomycetota bacterium]
MLAIFATIKERLERTGAPGEILQAIGVGGAVLGLLLWTIFFSGDATVTHAASSQTETEIESDESTVPTASGTRPERTTSSAVEVEQSVRKYPSRYINLDIARWEEAYETKSEPAASYPEDKVRVIESWARISADVMENTSGLSIAEVDD